MEGGVGGRGCGGGLEEGVRRRGWRRGKGTGCRGGKGGRMTFIESCTMPFRMDNALCLVRVDVFVRRGP